MAISPSLTVPAVACEGVEYPHTWAGIGLQSISDNLGDELGRVFIKTESSMGGRGDVWCQISEGD